MRRGDIWTVAGGKDYAGKPRPVVIVQDHSFDATDSITVCAFTTDETEAPLFRLPVEPNERNGLRAACRLMVDKRSPRSPRPRLVRASAGWTTRTSRGSIRRCSGSSDWRPRPGRSGRRKSGDARRSEFCSELAVGAVRSDLVSACKFPVRRENTGNFPDFGL